MKASDLKKIMKEDREVCANHWLDTLTAEEAARLALRVFPVGSTPGNQFTVRELEIIKRLVWQTNEMKLRVDGAMMQVAQERGGATLEDTNQTP